MLSLSLPTVTVLPAWLLVAVVLVVLTVEWDLRLLLERRLSLWVTSSSSYSLSWKWRLLELLELWWCLWERGAVWEGDEVSTLLLSLWRRKKLLEGL